MRKNRIIALLFAVTLSLGGCKEEAFKPQKEVIEEPQEKLMELHLTSSTKYNDMIFRGEDDGNDKILEIKKHLSQDIQSIYFLFFAPSGREYILKEQIYYPVFRSGDSMMSDAFESLTLTDTGVDIKFTPIKVKRSNYKLIVLFNPYKTLLNKLQLNKTNLKIFESPVSIYPEDPKNELAIHNAYVCKDGPIIIKPTQDNPNSNSDSSQHHQLFEMTPVSSYYTLSFEGLSVEGGRIGDEVKIYPDVVNKSFVPFPTYSKMIIRPGVESDFSLPRDGNFTTLKDFDQINAQFFRIEDSKLSQTRMGKTMNIETPSSNPFYGIIPENTVQGPEFFATNCSRLILALNYAPETIELGASWASYKGRVFNDEEFKNLITKVTTTEVDKLNAYEQALKSDFETGKSFLENFIKQTTNSKREIDRANYILSGMNTHSNSYHIRGISYHYKGICFYAVPFVHKEIFDSSSSKIFKLYSAVRNHLYHISVGKIRKPGKAMISRLPTHEELKEENTSGFNAGYNYPEKVDMHVEF
ncbi:MAG: fimbria major subunit [Porphyromonas sp.]|nr:fimbria major subunit [Porphyromonas sp.]